MHTYMRHALTITAVALASHATAQVTFYENDNFGGRSFTTEQQVGNFNRFGFNDRASSVVVAGDRRDRWEACEDVRFGGRCVVLRPGQYPSLALMGLNNRISSVRSVGQDERVEDNRYPPVPVISQITFYENDNFAGRSFTTEEDIRNFNRFGFNDRASSVVVAGDRNDRWEVCEDLRYGGRCIVLRPGQYTSLGQMGLNNRISSVRSVDRDARIEPNRYPPAPQPVAQSAPMAVPQAIFYEREGFEGRSHSADAAIEDFGRFGFNDRASSVVVLGAPWEACSDNGFSGRCVVLRPGRYPSLAAMGMNDRISSVRIVSPAQPVAEHRYAPPAAAVYDNRRRHEERLYQANITSVRAVVGPAEQRCWMERGEVVQSRGDANIGGAIAGALIGGILGHQVGGGSGKDLATVGGAVAGAAFGSNVGRNNAQTTSQDVQRCTSQPSQAQPAYWDVTYSFRGLEHRIQMTTQPGATISVNEQGEPRA